MADLFLALAPLREFMQKVKLQLKGQSATAAARTANNDEEQAKLIEAEGVEEKADLMNAKDDRGSEEPENVNDDADNTELATAEANSEAAKQGELQKYLDYPALSDNPALLVKLNVPELWSPSDNIFIDPQWLCCHCHDGQYGKEQAWAKIYDGWNPKKRQDRFTCKVCCHVKCDKCRITNVVPGAAGRLWLSPQFDWQTQPSQKGVRGVVAKMAERAKGKLDNLVERAEARRGGGEGQRAEEW